MKLSTVMAFVVAAGMAIAVLSLGVMYVTSIRTGSNVLRIGLFLAAAGMLSAICAATLERGRVRWIMLASIVMSFLASLLWWLRTGNIVGPSPTAFFTTLALATGLAGLGAVIAVLYADRLENGVSRVFRGLTILVAMTLVLVVTWHIAQDGTDDDSLAGIAVRDIIITLSLATFLGIPATIFLARSRDFIDGKEVAAEVRLPLVVWCPRCETRDTMTTGGGACSQCGLAISVRIP